MRILSASDMTAGDFARVFGPRPDLADVEVVIEDGDRWWSVHLDIVRFEASGVAQVVLTKDEDRGRPGTLVYPQLRAEPLQAIDQPSTLDGVSRASEAIGSADVDA